MKLMICLLMVFAFSPLTWAEIIENEATMADCEQRFPEFKRGQMTEEMQNEFWLAFKNYTTLKIQFVAAEDGLTLKLEDIRFTYQAFEGTDSVERVVATLKGNVVTPEGKASFSATLPVKMKTAKFAQILAEYNALEVLRSKDLICRMAVGSISLSVKAQIINLENGKSIDDFGTEDYHDVRAAKERVGLSLAKSWRVDLF